MVTGRDSNPAARLADRLGAARRRQFVGRAAELELMRALLDEPQPTFNILYVFGPGGIGKSSLLREYQRLATEAARPAIYLDARDVQPSPHGFTLALAQALGLPPDADPMSTLLEQNGMVLLVDTFEAIDPLEHWLRHVFLPMLPAGNLTVIASRNPPAEEWRSDHGWASLTRVVALRNLRPEESRALLAMRGVPAAQHEAILRLTYGHPLALSLAAELASEGPTPDQPDTQSAEVMTALVRRFVSSAPTVLHRQALEIASVAHRTTQATLVAALRLEGQDETARNLYEWLRGLSTMEQGPTGLFPHDVVRDAIFEDLRVRDPEELRRITRRIVWTEASRFLQSHGPDQHAAFWGMMYARRYVPSIAPFYDWRAMGRASAQPARPEERTQILDIVEQHEGRESARVAERWFEQQPGAFHAFRSLGGELDGFACHLLVDPEDEANLFDPALVAIRAHVRRYGTVRPGQRVAVHRYWMMRDGYQNATAHNTTAPVAVAQWMTGRDLAWSFVVARDMEFWVPHFGMLDFQPAEGGDFTLGPHRYGMFAHDWNREPPQVWWQSSGRRLDQGGTNPVAPERPPDARVALSQPEFGESVRRAYRDFLRPDALAANPLARSRLVRESDPTGEPGQTLQRLLREAAESLRGHPRDAKLYRAIWHTYIEPAPTQEAVAELLDLPFSTYRYQLGKGLERATEWLWRRELYGPDS